MHSWCTTCDYAKFSYLDFWNFVVTLDWLQVTQALQCGVCDFSALGVKHSDPSSPCIRVSYLSALSIGEAVVYDDGGQRHLVIWNCVGKFLVTSFLYYQALLNFTLLGLSKIWSHSQSKRPIDLHAVLENPDKSSKHILLSDCICLLNTVVIWIIWLPENWKTFWNFISLSGVVWSVWN